MAAGIRRKQEGPRPDDTPVSIDSVGAVALAREAFPDRLLIKLNSRSNENTPFTNPAEVYDALAWLATAHCDANDNRIGETCTGWTYKTSQRENRSRSTASGTRRWPTGRPGTSAPTSAREPAATRGTPSGLDSCATRKTTA